MAWSISHAMMKAYENSLSSQVQVAESLEVTCSGGKQSAPSNTTPIPDQYYWPDKTTEHSRLSRFGMTCEPLTEDYGTALLTWYLAGFPAKVSVLLEKELDLRMSGVDCGLSNAGSLMRYDHISRGWKTAQLSLLGDSEPFLGTWPRWGSMRNGVCYQEEISAPYICEREFGFSVPTTGKNEGKGASQKRFLGSLHFRGAKMCEALRNCESDPIYLNPSFAELTMMWPLGWTDLQPLGMAKFLEWQQQHGGF